MTKKHSTKSIILIVIVSTIASAIGGAIVKKYFSTGVTMDAALVQISSEINKSCPMMIDSVTRLDNTFGGPGNRLLYSYTLLNITASEVDSTIFDSLMRPGLIANYETNRDMGNFREKNVTLVYHYKDKDGIQISKIEITPSDFEKSAK